MNGLLSSRARGGAAGRPAPLRADLDSGRRLVPFRQRARPSVARRVRPLPAGARARLRCHEGDQLHARARPLLRIRRTRWPVPCSCARDVNGW